MERRRFLSLLGLGVAGIALEQAVPLGRVWSFPKEIAIARHPFDYSNELSRANRFLMQYLLEAQQQAVIDTMTEG